MEKIFWYEIISLPYEKFIKLCRFDKMLGSGKGGQKRNKTHNAVRLVFGSLLMNCGQFRSLQQNTSFALKKLQLQIACSSDLLLKEKKIKVIRMTKEKEMIDFQQKSLKQYFYHKKITVNHKNKDYILVVGLLIDAFLLFKKNSSLTTESSIIPPLSVKWHQVANLLKISSSQLQKFVKKEKVLFSKI